MLIYYFILFIEVITISESIKEQKKQVVRRRSTRKSTKIIQDDLYEPETTKILTDSTDSLQEDSSKYSSFFFKLII